MNPINIINPKIYHIVSLKNNHESISLPDYKFSSLLRIIDIRRIGYKIEKLNISDPIITVNPESVLLTNIEIIDKIKICKLFKKQ